MASSDVTCGAWKRGVDCTFDAHTFHVSWICIWAGTCVLLTGASFARTLNGCFQRCAALGAVASLLAAVDPCIALFVGPDETSSKFAIAGSFLLAIALVNLTDHWCEVAGLLSRVSQSMETRQTTAASLRWVKLGYKGVAFIHYPLAVLRSSLPMEASMYSKSTAVFIVWSFAVSTCVSLLLAGFMWMVSARLRGVPNSAGLRFVAVGNLLEQVRIFILNVLALIIHATSKADEQEGFIMATNAWVCGLIYAGMPMQFFLVYMLSDSSDVICNDKGFRGLVASQDSAAEKNMHATKIGTTSGGVEPTNEHTQAAPESVAAEAFSTYELENGTPAVNC